MIRKQFATSLVAMLCTLGVNDAAVAASVRLVGPSTTVRPGDSLQLQVIADLGAQPLSSVAIFLEFDEAAFRYDSGATNRSVFDDQLLTSEPQADSSGYISFLASSTNPLVGDGFLVGTVTLTARQAGDHTFRVLTTEPRVTSGLNSAGDVISFTGLPYDLEVDGLPQAHLLFTPATQTASVGIASSVQLRFDRNGTPARSLRVRATFDPTALALVGSDLNEEIYDSQLLTDPIVTVPAGTISFNAGAVAPLPAGEHTVADFQFIPLRAGAHEVNFATEFERGSFAKDGDFQTILTNHTRSTLLVGAGTESPRLLFTPSSSTAFVGGTVTLDGAVSSGAPYTLIDSTIIVPTRLTYLEGTTNTSFPFNPTYAPPSPVPNSGLIYWGNLAFSPLTGYHQTASLRFLANAPGTANVLFDGTRSAVVDGSSSLNFTSTPANVTIYNPYASTHRISPVTQTLDLDTTFTVDVMLHPEVATALESRVFMSYRADRVEFISGAINTSTFGNLDRLDEPTLSAPGVISFSAAASAPLDPQPVRVATLTFRSRSALGAAGFEFLLGGGESALLGTGFTPLPLFTHSGAAFVIGDAPIVQGITRDDASPTTTGPLEWTVTFSKPVTGVNAADFVLTGGLTTGTTVTTLSPISYRVAGAISAGAQGAVELQLVDDDSIRDIGGNPLAGEGLENGNATGAAYVVDARGPSLIFTPEATSPTNATTLLVRVITDEPLTAPSTDSFTVTTVGTLTATVEGLVELVDGYRLTLSVAGNGELSVGSAGNLTDLVGNPPRSISSPSIAIDQLPPIVTAATRLDPSPTFLDSVRYAVTFSEPVVGLGVANAAFAVTGVSGASASSVSGSGSDFTMTVSTGTGDGSLRLRVIPGGMLRDAAGNPLGSSFEAAEVYNFVRVGKGPTGLSNGEVADGVLGISEAEPARLDVNEDQAIDSADITANGSQLQ
jgi:hypothetical protein